jgi:hypothetical protein
MQTSVNNVLQSPALAVPESKVQRSPSDLDASAGKKAHLKLVTPATLPDDVVTLTDPDRTGKKAESAKPISSIPVTSAEKKALLRPHPSGYNFSVYG